MSSHDDTPTPDALGEAGAPTARSRRRRRAPLVAAGTALAVLVSGGAVYAAAHKDVTLDIAGSDTRTGTFAGSVRSLLDDKGIELGAHDTVSPTLDTHLKDGQTVTVRFGHQVTVDVDGTRTTVWTTALDAGEALNVLAGRGEDVSLVASRSASTGRAALPLELSAHGPVAVVADGATRVVQDASAGTDAVLASAGITLGADDRVRVERRDGEPAVALVVERVAVTTKKTTKPVAFTTVRSTDASRYEDLGPLVTREGRKGVKTTTYRVTTVDGKVESRELVGTKVTRKPVSELVVTGTKDRPAPVAPKPSAPSAAASSSPSKPAAKSSGGSAPTGGVWAALARCESGGNPKAVNPAGYYGLYQFTVGTWRSLGGTGLPTDASPATQTALAQKLQARSGWGQWPACSAKLGLR